MKKLLLLIALVFGFGLAAHAQDDSMGAPPPAGDTQAQALDPAKVAKAAAPDAPASPAPGQPINFNHQLHVNTAKLGCKDCHESNRGGATLAIPQAPKCMLCHAAIATDKPDIQHLAQAAKDQELIQWVRVYRVPSFVTFSHKTHTDAGATCAACHGPVEQRTAIALEKDIHMPGCINCHTQAGAPTTCDTCHAPMSKNGHSPFDADEPVLARLHLLPSQRPPVAQSSARTFVSQLAASISTYVHAPSL